MSRLALLAVLPLLTLACGPEYDPWFDGYCFRLIGVKSYQDAQKQCDADGTFVTSIHSEEENTQFRKVVGHSDVYIGIYCDDKNQLVWEDGSEVTYSNFRGGVPNCGALPSGTRFVQQADGMWDSAPTSMAVCRQLARTIDECDEFEVYDAVRHSGCVRLFKNAENWDDAEAICKTHNANLASIHDSSFNSYVRREAVSNSFLDGIHIGLKYNSSVDGENYYWTDGSATDYSSWAKKMPNHNIGDCIAMETGIVTGEWVNFDCTSKLPYICKKDKTSIPRTHQNANCPRLNEYSPGDEIYSPSFPHPPGTTSCDYMLLGGSGTKKLIITIETFEVNECCESLEITSGLVGHNVVHTLTGSIAPGTEYVIDSNSARIQWNSTSGANVRGWHIKMDAQ